MIPVPATALQELALFVSFILFALALMFTIATAIELTKNNRMGLAVFLSIFWGILFYFAYLLVVFALRHP